MYSRFISVQADCQNNNRMLENAIAFEIIVPAIKFCFCASSPEIMKYNNILNIVIAMVFVGLCFLSLHRMSTKEFGRMLFILMLAFFIYGINFLLYPIARDNLIEHAPKVFGVSILVFAITLEIKWGERLLKLLTIGSYMIAVSAIYFLMAIRFLGESGLDSNYSLALSNFLILPICLLGYEFCKKRSIISFLFTILLVGIAFLYGSRSFILSIVLFGVMYYYYIINKGKNTRNLVLICLFSIIAVTVLVLFWDSVQGFLLYLYDALHIESRTIHMLLTNPFYTSGRNIIIEEIIVPAIKEHPIIGTGMLGVTGAHNIFWELLVSHGLILGSIIVLLLMRIVLRKLQGLKHEVEWSQILFMVFFSYSIVDSLTHLTVLGKDYFWVCLALCFLRWDKRFLNTQIKVR